MRRPVATRTPPSAPAAPVIRHAELSVSDVRAWEMIEPGRFQPRRTRGSFPGRDLG
jgi:hypothetical protein